MKLRAVSRDHCNLLLVATLLCLLSGGSAGAASPDSALWQVVVGGSAKPGFERGEAVRIDATGDVIAAGAHVPADPALIHNTGGVTYHHVHTGALLGFTECCQRLLFIEAWNLDY